MILPDFIERGLVVLSDLKEQSGQIMDGFTNLFLDKLDQLRPEEQAVYAARYEHCISCPMRIGNACSKHQKQKRVGADCYVRGCGCQLSAMVKSPTKHCVMHKWPPIDPATLLPKPYPADKLNNLCKPL